MVKKVITSSLVATMLLLSACGDDSEGESRLETQQMLDDEDYEGVISKLSSSATTDDEHIALGAAYMGKAGLSLSNIVGALAEDSQSGGEFAGFIKSIKKTSSSTALSDLDVAINYYQKVVQNACISNAQNLSDSQKDICLFIGLASTSSAAVTIDLIAGDIEKFGSDTKDNKLTASTCAMQYAFDRNATECSVTPESNVTFSASNKTYTPLLVTVNSDTDTPKNNYRYLMNDANRTVLTNGFCTNSDFTTRIETYSGGLYACPINETNTSKELTTAGVLVDVLNNGIGAVSSASSEDTQESVDEFKCEILGGSYNGNSCTENLNADVEEPDVIEYLNTNNGN